MKKSMIKRQEEAQERKNEYQKLTQQQKIEKLDKKLGKGVGAQKQRKKLNEQKKNG